MRLHKEDEVLVLQGKDKGKKGKIEKIISRKNMVFVSGVNLYKKHVKNVPGRKGGIYEIPRPIAFSKLAIVCPKCSKLTRAGFKVVRDEKVRICRKCGGEINTKKK